MVLSCAARAVVVAVLSGLTACGGTSTPSSSPTSTSAPATSAPPTTVSPATTIELRFAQGEAVGGPGRETVALGETVVLRATSDVTEELHVHTYDLRSRLVPGQPTELRFTASIPGRHEVEFERSAKTALTLEVR
jgi:hypothetical protein